MKKNSLILYLIYLPLSIFIILSWFLPIRLFLWLGKMLGRTGYFFAGKRRKIAGLNLKAAFAQTMDRKRRKAIVVSVFENLGLNLAELLLMGRLKNDYYRKNIELINFKFADDTLKQNKGMIFLTAHFGNWELSSVISAIKGYRIMVLARAQRPYFLNRILNHYRQQKGCLVISKGMQLREIVKHLKSKEIIGMLGDQSGRQGKEIEFFGRKIFMAEGAFRMAATTGAVILPNFIMRQGYKHKLFFEQPLLIKSGPDLEQQIERAMVTYRDLLEKYITMAPGQWLWLNKRWKYTKTKSIMILTDGKVGHFRQAQAVADEILGEMPTSRLMSVEISFKHCFWQHILTFLVLGANRLICHPVFLLKIALKKECFRKLENIFSDIIICSGAATRAVALLFARENQAKTICIMNPVPYSPERFDLAIIPEHDRPKQTENVLVTKGALNLITEEYLKKNVHNLRSHTRIDERLKVGFLIGGDSKYYQLDLSVIDKILKQIKKFIQDSTAQLLVTTSRRTPKDITKFLQLQLGQYPPCVFKVFPPMSNYDFAVGGILGLCEVVIVSGESISMVSEAACAGTYPIVFRLAKKDRRKNVKHDFFLQDLDKAGAIRLVNADNVYEELLKFKEGTYSLRKLDDRKNLAKILKKKILK